MTSQVQFFASFILKWSNKILICCGRLQCPAIKVSVFDETMKELEVLTRCYYTRVAQVPQTATSTLILSRMVAILSESSTKLSKN